MNNKNGIGGFKLSVPFFIWQNKKDNNRKIVKCELINDNGHYKIDFEKFKKLSENKNNKLLILCSPHNPIGRVWSKEELEKIGEIALKNDLIIISDEIHFDIIIPNNKHTIFQTISKKLSEIKNNYDVSVFSAWFGLKLQ